MKFRHLLTASVLGALASAASDEEDILDFVDPLIGSVEGGNFEIASGTFRLLTQFGRTCVSRREYALWHGQSRS